MNVYCFKPLHFGVICYITIDNIALGVDFILKWECGNIRNIIRNNWSCILSIFLLHVEINSHYVKNIAALSMVYLECKVRKCTSELTLSSFLQNNIKNKLFDNNIFVFDDFY